jgi:hypothetical protein
MHRQRNSRTETPKDTPDPPAIITAEEYKPQFVFAGDPNGPSTQTLSSTPDDGKVILQGFFLLGTDARRQEVRPPTSTAS